MGSVPDQKITENETYRDRRKYSDIIMAAAAARVNGVAALNQSDGTLQERLALAEWNPLQHQQVAV